MTASASNMGTDFSPGLSLLVAMARAATCGGHGPVRAAAAVGHEPKCEQQAAGDEQE